MWGSDPKPGALFIALHPMESYSYPSQALLVIVSRDHGTLGLTINRGIGYFRRHFYASRDGGKVIGVISLSITLVLNRNYMIIPKRFVCKTEHILSAHLDRGAYLNTRMVTVPMNLDHIAALHGGTGIDKVIQLFFVGQKLVVPLFGLGGIKRFALL